MGNLSEAGMLAYLQAFHDVFRRKAVERLPPDLRTSLARWPHLDDGITGYVSTRFGAGFEYTDDEPGIRIVRGSSRVEELLFEAPGRVRRLQQFFAFDGGDNHVEGMTLEGLWPVRLTSSDASVRLVDLAAVALGWRREVRWAELYGNRDADAWSVAVAGERAMDELLVALVDEQQMGRRQEDLGDLLVRLRQGRVLVLGDFGDGRRRLDAVGDALERMGYVPVFADQIPDIPDQDLPQKVMKLSLLCRFVVVEDSRPAGQLTEIPLVADKATTVVLRERGRGASWMTRGVSLGRDTIKEVEYDPDALDEVLSECARWAEDTIERRGQRLDATYPWRTPR
jgi:hypothetical protein